MRTLLILAALAVVAALSGAWFVYSGLYNLSATQQHTAPVYWLLNVAMRQAVKHHAQDIRVPPLLDPALIDSGRRLYRAHCAACHGAPGIAPDAFALGLMPVPANLALTAREWKNPAELFWVAKYGIKMSGMPAWEFRLAEVELWAVVAFVGTLPALSPLEYRVAIAGDDDVKTSIVPVTIDASAAGGDAVRGQVALQQYACVSCHVIPGVVGAASPVGPSLARIGSRKYLAGILPNTREAMVEWLRAPQRVAPGTAMPDLGVSVRDAQDIAAYLGTLR